MLFRAIPFLLLIIISEGAKCQEETYIATNDTNSVSLYEVFTELEKKSEYNFFFLHDSAFHDPINFIRDSIISISLIESYLKELGYNIFIDANQNIFITKY